MQYRYAPVTVYEMSRVTKFFCLVRYEIDTPNTAAGRSAKISVYTPMDQTSKHHFRYVVGSVAINSHCQHIAQISLTS